ncbi:MAG: RluA family pseudouridine synthase [Alphaproteobacteria bacterium]
MEQQKFIISKEFDGLRLDKALSVLIKDMSRSRIQELIKQENILVNNQSGKWGSSKVREGMEIIVNIPEPENLELIPQDIPLNIVFEDEHLLIIDKVSGMVVHPASGNPDGTVVNAVLHHCGDSLSGIGGVKRPGIVHRIDKDTSGLLVIAKSDNAHNGLCDLFKTHDIERMYTAYTWGVPQPKNGTVDMPIGRHKSDRKKMAVMDINDPTGKTATTHYTMVENYRLYASKITCKLETGRTHQIRVHMNHLKNPLIGDPVYGRTPKVINQEWAELKDFLDGGFNRQALHASTLGFVHPITGEELLFESELPNDMQNLEKILENH